MKSSTLRSGQLAGQDVEKITIIRDSSEGDSGELMAVDGPIDRENREPQSCATRISLKRILMATTLTALLFGIARLLDLPPFLSAVLAVSSLMILVLDDQTSPRLLYGYILSTWLLCLALVASVLVSG